MQIIDDPRGWLTSEAPEPEAPDEQLELMGALKIDDLMRLAFALLTVSVREDTQQCQVAAYYFEQRIVEQPQRAFDLILAMLRSDADERLKLEVVGLINVMVHLQEKRFLAWLRKLGPEKAQVVWLLGGVYAKVEDADLKKRLEPIADHARWVAEEARLMAPKRVIDWASLSVPELAHAWIEQRVQAAVYVDGNYQAMVDYFAKTRVDDPDRVIDFIATVLRLETDPMVLETLAKGQFQKVIAPRTIDRMEREALSDPRFARLLRQADYESQPENIRARLDAIRDALPDEDDDESGWDAAADLATRALPKVDMELRGPGFFDDPDSKPVETVATIGPALARELDAKPIKELARIWCANQFYRLQDKTERVRFTEEYFDHLPNEQPERAWALALAVLRTDADKVVKMQLENKFMSHVVNSGRPGMIDQVEAAAKADPQMRWLLGGIILWVRGAAVRERLEPYADRDAWSADKAVLQASPPQIDFASLSTAELARTWVDLFSQHSDLQFRNENYNDMHVYQQALIERDPGAALDLVLEVLRIEQNEDVLYQLASYVMHPLTGPGTIDRIEREAARNERLAWFIGGIARWAEDENVGARLDAIVTRHRAKA